MRYTVSSLNVEDIAVIDTPGCTGSKCKCNKNAMFILIIHGNTIQLCEKCFATVGKAVIDGLT